MNVPMTKLINKINTAFSRFVVVGVMNTINFYIIYFILLLFDVHYQAAFVAAYLLSMIGSYFMNTLFVYKTTVSLKKFFAFPLVYVVQFALNYVGIIVCVEVLNIAEEFAPFIFLPITVILTFVLTRTILTRGDSR
ncbi:GtrA family protein [Alteribacter lacisalsi]|nr:GtrA family protein [Alteribacter lacisalsi]